MKIEIAFPLSQETAKFFGEAVTKVEKSKQQKHGQVVDLRLSDDGQGNPVGIIVMDEPI